MVLLTKRETQVLVLFLQRKKICVVDKADILITIRLLYQII